MHVDVVPENVDKLVASGRPERAFDPRLLSQFQYVERTSCGRSSRSSNFTQE